MNACQKRPISMDKLEKLINEVEVEIQKKYDQEVDSKDIGEMVVEKLAQIDDVAYVRFASVYRQFKDINQFMRELREIWSKRLK
jgi:transcriptional repressor NrdR